jgi:hypothetical protein
MKSSTEIKMKSAIDIISASKMEGSLKQAQIDLVANCAEASNGLEHEEKVQKTSDCVFEISCAMGTVCTIMQKSQDKIEDLTAKFDNFTAYVGSSLGDINNKIDKMAVNGKWAILRDCQWSIVAAIAVLTVGVIFAPTLIDLLRDVVQVAK